MSCRRQQFHVDMYTVIVIVVLTSDDIRSEVTVVHLCNLILQYMAPRSDIPFGLDQGCCMQAPWLLMIETDYVWMKPLQAPLAEDTSAASLGFPFGYISPQAPNIEGVMRKMYPVEKGPLSDVPGSGPAPALMRIDEWIKVQLPISIVAITLLPPLRLLSHSCKKYGPYNSAASLSLQYLWLWSRLWEKCCS